MSATTGIAFDHVALSVTDLDASAEFYESVVGLKEISNRTKIDGIRQVYVQDPDGCWIEVNGVAWN